MPTYRYRCGECGDEFEVWQSIKDPGLETHDGSCGGPLLKVLTPAGIVLKGSGFYKNDSRSSSRSAPKDGDKGDGAEGDGAKGDGASDGSGSSDGDSKSSDASSGSTSTDTKAGDGSSGAGKSGEGSSSGQPKTGAARP